jgi:3-oxoacyl-[acyl-carrier-protein] synthase III
MMSKNVGILGTGFYLPEQIRTNDWWPAAIVEGWRERQAQNTLRGVALAKENISEGARRTIEALSGQNGDPFEGARERRVLPREQDPSDMEAAAAKQAIERAGIEASQIDFVLSYSPCPDDLLVNQACVTHRKVGLREDCFAMSTDVGCNAFAQQLRVAQAFIASGQARYGLLTQSTTLQQRIPREEAASAWFGDIGTAQVVGPVAEGRGLLAASHRTDGTMNRALVLGVEGKKWFDDGAITMHTADGVATKRMLFSLVDWAKHSLDEALSMAGLQPTDVDFYCSHQATVWLRRVTQEYVGMTNARFVDTFPWTGSLVACNSPLQMAIAEREGVLKPGNIVAVFGGGTGVTRSGMVMRWGA